MKLLASLEARDRRWLLWSVGLAVALAVVFSVLAPDDNDDNPTQSSYLTGKHGARAAYETLVNAGYPIERWERPLAELAAQSDPTAVLILAAPHRVNDDEAAAVRRIVAHGGRVFSTGIAGGYVVPEGAPDVAQKFRLAACRLEPEGLGAIASSGEVWMVPQWGWNLDRPGYRVDYSCDGQPAVVEYDYGNGHVVWWASSSPLENASIARGANLDLLLNSVGPCVGHHFYWDESLNGAAPTTWSYASGPSLTLLRFGLLAMFVLIVFSFSRRNGPVRELPMPARAAPIEYLDALGALYQNTGSASTAASVALDRFRRHGLRLCGQSTGPMPAHDLASIIRRRFPQMDPALEADLAAAEAGAQDESLEPRAALRIVQALQAHQQRLSAAAHAHGARSVHINATERAS
jgi:hypothetical protein